MAVPSGCEQAGQEVGRFQLLQVVRTRTRCTVAPKAKFAMDVSAIEGMPMILAAGKHGGVPWWFKTKFDEAFGTRCRVEHVGVVFSLKRCTDRINQAGWKRVFLNW